MEIILKEDIKKLGYKNDIVDVKPGYARNFLIPQGKAIIANNSNKKMLAENIKQASHKAEKAIVDAKALAEKLGNTVLEVRTKVGENGKIFGSITPLLVQEALKAATGVEVDRKKIDFSNKIKEVGEYDVELDLHKTVKHTMKFNVVAE